MIGAFLTTIFFSLSVIFAQRSIRALGATRANIGRLVVALIILGIYAHTIGGGLSTPGVMWFLLSGVAGMGLGDIASFAAMPKLGSRLTVLITQCVAAPLGAVAEWLWMGTRITLPQALWGCVILAGVALALMPSKSQPPRVTIKASGFLWGLGAAAGQGFGAVISRKGNLVTELAGQQVDGITAAYQRILGGLVIALLFFSARSLFVKETPDTPAPRRSGRIDYVWMAANGVCGAVIGVSCYQWALSTTPSAIVLPIVATTPLVIVPLSFWLEGERPSRRSLAGGALAVVGAVALSIAR